ncbi:hypothetical protein N0V93_004088 [Gnomoniopsis smithogilvyi]|uniref:Major facilitator superfamily (MFS) profile domain-containing protein n=1 Tax=Gnomoniopsis smithogilvyi TaxID=1191159 RepID=A0A9W8YZX9_9PEZI|nr:hypothetical protein N0V93_004088 [Gnomoniopsis smithogilvyi]
MASNGDHAEGGGSMRVATHDTIELGETKRQDAADEAQTFEKDMKEDEQTVEEVDDNLVTWDGPADISNPKNWSSRRRYVACVLLSFFNVVGPLSSAIIAPALPTIEKDLDTSETVGVMILSIYMLAFSVGPLVTSPLSEMYGRIIVLQSSNAFFWVFNTACGFARTPGQMLAFRFLSGLGGCAAQSIGGAIMGDMFTPLERVKAIAIYSIAPLLGPVLGPLCGGALTQYASWHWCFWVISIFDVFVQIAGFSFLSETYAPVLLRRKKNLLVKETGNENLVTEFDGNLKWKTLLKNNMKRPFNMLLTQPIVQIMGIYSSYAYGLAFMLSATMPMVYEGVYDQQPAVASLNYLPPTIGVVIMTQMYQILATSIYKRLIARAPDNKARPEFRIPLLFPATFFAAVGLLWYGWSAQEKLHVVMPNVGTVILTAGTNVSFYCVNQYLIDAYSVHAASALGAATILRGVFGFVIPLIAPGMFLRLGFGIGTSILAVVAVAVGFPSAVLIWLRGPQLRGKSLFAKK